MNTHKTLDLIQNILIILVGLIFIALFISLNIGESSADKWRRTPEGNCLEDIAREFCLGRDMEFGKIYSPLYRSIWSSEDFICIDRNNRRVYSFSNDEEIKCERDLIS